jgi:hypothetical protein
MGPVVGVVAAIGAIVGTGLQFLGQQKAAAAQRKQNRIAKRQADLEAARRRRAILREYALNRAKSVAQFGAAGAGFGSSGLFGATASQSGAAGGSLVAVNQAQQLGGQQLKAQNAESRGNQLAGIGQSISNLTEYGVNTYDRLA